MTRLAIRALPGILRSGLCWAAAYARFGDSLWIDAILCSAVAACVAGELPLPRPAPLALRVAALVALVATGIAHWFSGPGAGASLSHAALLAAALVLGCAASRGVAGRTVFVACCTLLAAASALVLPNVASEERFVADAARAIAQTDVREALAYVRHLAERDTGAWFAAAVWLVAALVLFRSLDRAWGAAIATPRAAARIATLAAAALVAIPGARAVATESTPGRFTRDVAEAVRDFRGKLKGFREVRDARRAGAPEAAQRTPLLEEERRIVVVIGESTTRAHWSLYGYPRPTNAALEDWRDQLVLYSDVISPHSHTVPALERVLAGVDDGRGISLAEAVDVVTIARAGGYDVTWLSAQHEYGIWDNLARAIAEGANDRVFVDSDPRLRRGERAMDAQLVSALDAALARGRRRIVFVHLMGAHGPYCERFDRATALPTLPRDEADALFGPGVGNVQQIDCYDKAMAYGSRVLADILEVSRSRGADTVLYFSDHGESPASGTGHESRLHVAEHVQIPLLWSLDERFWSRHPAEAAAIRANRSKPMLSSDLYHALQDVMGVRSERFVAARSPLRDGYAPSPRLLFEGRWDYDRWSREGDDAERVRANLRALAAAEPALHRRVWAHRVNTLGKLLQAMESFAGVELDVVLEDEELVVYHPPAKNVNLRLSEYLRVAQHRPDLLLWLDLKLPERGVDDAAVATLLRSLDERFSIRARAVVELPPDHARAALAARLAADGWRVSRYLPAPAAAPGRAAADPGEAWIRRERDYLASGRFACVSYDAAARPLASAIVAVPSLRSLERLSWDLSLDASKETFVERARSFPEAVLLVRMPSRYEN
jgi:glucan phosphoethanolaminetransferase (alkaline phosphatase superfamily)